MTRFFVVLLLTLCVAAPSTAQEPANVTFSFAASNFNGGSCNTFPTLVGYGSASLAAIALRDAYIDCFPSFRNIAVSSPPVIGGPVTITLEECNNWNRNQCFGTWEPRTRYSDIFASPTCSISGFSPSSSSGAWLCYPSQACPSAGTPATLARLTTIQSVTETGYIVPVGSMPNPQCLNQCRVQHPGGQLLCTAFYPINGLVAGGPVFVSCSTDVTHTGTPCNYGGAGGIETLDEVATKPGTFTQQEGSPTDGGGGGDGSALLGDIAAYTEQTAHNTGTSADTLQQIAENQVTSENNAQGRSQSLLDKLDQLLGRLTSIDDKTGTGGGSGGDGVSSISIEAGDSVGEVALDVETPEGGLVAPGEKHEGLAALLNPILTPPDAGSCPTWTFDIPYLDANIVMDTHCTLWQQNAAALSALMLGIWTIGALFLVLSA